MSVTDRRRTTVRLAVLFGTIYFIQGVGEPTEGLIAQPVRALLKRWGRDAEDIAAFMALLALPWSLKPLFGALTDFVPLGGSRRRSWLLAASAATVVGLLGAWALDLPRGAAPLLFALLVVPTIGVAFSDVVADALMIERGKPLGITGRLQSVQWGAMYGAGIITGVLGGWLAERHLERLGFLICGGLTLVTLVCAALFVREEPVAPPRRSPRQALGELWRTARSPAVVGVGSFLFLWSFNPFSSTVLYMHLTTSMGMSETFYGTTSSVFSVASIAACLVYGGVAPRLTPRTMLHGSIAFGVVATLLYAGVRGEASALAVSAAAGFTYMTASLAQLDLAARACSAATAGTVFALLMALCNLSLSLSTGLGGAWYEALGAGDRAFQAMVVAGAVSTALCWPLTWLLRGTFGALLDEAAVNGEEEAVRAA